MKLIASNQMTLTNIKERAIDRTEVTFWHGLSATKHPLGIYDCPRRDHVFGNEFNVTSGKTYTVRVIAKQTRGSVRLAGGIWYTAMTSGHPFDTYGAFTLVGELSEDGLGVYERKVVVASGKTKGKIFIQLEQTSGGGYSTAWRIYDGQVFDENGQPLVTDQNNLGALTSPMAAPDGTYIWKRTITYYTDGTNDTVWEYNGVGEKGNTGANGQTSHVHFAFADNATGGGFSLTTPKAYMGWYADFNEAASTDPTKYRWSKWKGDQGLPGKPGADGKTSYFHMAYADSADGRTGFSFKESGQQYQGYYTDFTQTNSTDPARYTWMDRRAGVEVGGRNYIRDFGFVKNHNFYNTVSEWKFERVSDSTAWSGCTIKATCTKAGGGGFHKVLIDLRDAKWQGRTMTYSVYVKASKSIRMRLGSEAFNGGYQIFDATTSWQRFVSTDAVNYKKYYSFPFYSDSATWVIGDVVFLRDPQLEDGNIATTPIPALEDVQSDIDSKADQTLTQEQLNALVEKNSIIKAEMEAKASIDTVNQWITAYQNYVNANDEARAESEKNLQEAAARILQLKTDVGALRQQWDFIDTYMSIQNEGLIIGKSDGSAFAKFANDRISLFSGSSEVMYISQGTLHIENGIFTKTIQIGRFRFETHPADKDMLVLRYLGG